MSFFARKKSYLSQHHRGTFAEAYLHTFAGYNPEFEARNDCTKLPGFLGSGLRDSYNSRKWLDKGRMLYEAKRLIVFIIPVVTIAMLIISVVIVPRQVS